MTNQRTPVDGGIGLDLAMNKQRIDLETAAKFRFFFVGLVFAILSFAIQFPVKSVEFYLKLTESMSWGLIAVTGLLSLADVGGFTKSPEQYTRLTQSARFTMWGCFLIGVALLLVSKIWASFQS